MSFYNTSTIGYNDTSPYNGAPVNYTYTGSITVTLLPNNVTQFNSLPHTYSYVGNILTVFLLSSYTARGRNIIPSTDGNRIIMAPSSTAVHRRYLKIKDPVRTGGCPQCGTFLYNERC